MPVDPSPYNARLRRFSSRLQRLGHVYLKETLQGARHYKRIAGYFRSSIFELVNEELTGVGRIQIVCNSDLDPDDIRIAQGARNRLLKEKWNEAPTRVDALLNRDRYRRLYDLLSSGNLDIRVVARNQAPFLHGKAGIIEAADGSKSAFIGSLNETRHGWDSHYEILWEDSSEEGVAWVEAEFDHLWNQGVPLPDVIIEEIKRCADRTEYARVEDCPEANLPAATLVEAPIYRRGEALMPWQQAFVGMFMEHRHTFGQARLLLADEVGLGKTLSLAASAIMGCLLDDGPALILCPSNLRFQWQVELWDKLGVPSAVWTNRKTWQDHTGHNIKTRGPEDVANCPYQIGIVSTGLLFRDTLERDALLQPMYGTLILDEAHRARRAANGERNNLLTFIAQAAERSTHVLLGTATPIQTKVDELWDLLEVLGQGADHVLGRVMSRWRHSSQVLPLITGQQHLADDMSCWEYIRNPLPPRDEDGLYDRIRSDLGLHDNQFFTSRSVTELDPFTRDELNEKITERISGTTFFQRHNPILRHTVMRQRKALEDQGLLDEVAVDIHPSSHNQNFLFDGLGLRTSAELDWAYEEGETFVELLGQRTAASGFMKNLILQRICSSVASGISTAQKLFDKETLEEVEDASLLTDLQALTQEEKQCLQRIVHHLSAKPEDPKFEAVCHYLLDQQWLALGCIIFSQYLDTAIWVAESLARKLPEIPIAIYAGADQSKLFRDGIWSRVEREDIKTAVKEGQIKLVVATDAACEGLNLQTLGTLINIDLPWNPSRLEQRLGRIKRFGQRRGSVDMLNLVYQGTRDEAVYQRLSERMKNRYDIFGNLPDVIEDDWIQDIENMDRKMAEFIEDRKRANAFELRYSSSVNPKGSEWENCSEVLSRQDIIEKLSRAW